MARKPDSRATAGQQIEDRLDAITDEMRRRTVQWVAKSRLPAPNDQQMLGAIISGIAGGLLDELWQQTGGDPEKIRTGWAVFADSYLDAMLEDRAADAEGGPA